MFIKLGDFIFSVNEIRYIKKFPSGCNVYIKGEDKAVFVSGVTDEDYQNAIYILMKH